ncbi:MAG: mechanosensitive ion channel [Bacteroidales bacterium]|nr:mechanosensitive ion channel [Bacteroidales bacterium]
MDILLKEWLISLGLSENTAIIFRDLSELIIAIIIGLIAYYVALKIILKLVSVFAKKTKSHWDDVLLEKKFFKRLTYLVPAYIYYLLFPIALNEYPELSNLVTNLLGIYMLIITVQVISSFLSAFEAIYQEYEFAKSKPIKGYLQVVKIIIYVIIGIVVISILIGKSPITLLAGMGAMSAVIMLIFKDSILGFVGGIQLSANDMLRTGDWISMPKYGADGTVTDIALTTVKVQNWDKTISTIPTYSLITDSFQNWRGMEESGGRRIKRSINLDMESVKFCTHEMLERFKKFQHVAEYVDMTEKEVQVYNKKFNIDDSVLVNGRRQTNIGVFRAYLRGYLHHHEKISDTMTFLIRQLQLTERGLPIQVYVFSKVQAWADYEDIQSDIFDHILAIIPAFDLRIFQNPTGSDFRELKNKTKNFMK